MKQTTFNSYMMQSLQLSSTEYHRGYQYGLRRRFHGENFGEQERFRLMLERGGATAQGLQDGLSGRAPRIYCSQNDGDCSTCSLVNYGRDCENSPIA
jgi:hypothetical protein